MKERTKFGFAQKTMPATCPDCSGKLGPIQHGLKFDVEYRLVSPSFVDGCVIWRKCECGCVVTWGADVGKNHYHQVFFRRHVLPIFDDRYVLQIVDRS